MTEAVPPAPQSADAQLPTTRSIFGLRSGLVVRTTLASLAIGAVHGCSRPEACLEPGVVVRPDSFERKPDHETLSAWQDRVRASMRKALAIDDVQAHRVPVVIRTPAEHPPIGTVVLLHGHGYSALSIMVRADLGERLSARGWRVVAPALRGFARYPPGSSPLHTEYVAGLPKDAYLPAVLADLLKTIQLETEDHPGPTVVVGHSLGAYLALHVAALEPRIDAVFVGSLFVRTRCINSQEHHECQHHADLAERLGTEDIAMLVAPRRLEVMWGEQDAFFTDAARSLLAITKARFRAVGAADRFRSSVIQGIGHAVDGDTIVGFVDRVATSTTPLGSDRQR